MTDQTVTEYAVVSLLSRFRHDLAVDLGTANTLIYVSGRGVVVDEPSIIAMDKASGRILAVGTAAQTMLGRTPGSILTVRPVRHGVIADFDGTERLLRDLMRRAMVSCAFGIRPRVIVGVPSNITQVEQRAVKDAALRARAKEVFIVEESMAAAIGAGLPIERPTASMVVDIGGGTTDIAVIAMGGTVYSAAIAVAGDNMDAAIIDFVRRTYNVVIGERTAERVKMTIGSAIPTGRRLTTEVKGRQQALGLPTVLRLGEDDVRIALSPILTSISVNVIRALEHTPPELAGDIITNGITLTGGGALLQGIAPYLSVETGVPVWVANRPLQCVALGTGRMLDNLDLLKRVAVA